MRPREGAFFFRAVATHQAPSRRLRDVARVSTKTPRRDGRRGRRGRRSRDVGNARGSGGWVRGRASPGFPRARVGGRGDGRRRGASRRVTGIGGERKRRASRRDGKPSVCCFGGRSHLNPGGMSPSSIASSFLFADVSGSASLFAGTKLPYRKCVHAHSRTARSLPSRNPRMRSNTSSCSCRSKLRVSFSRRVRASECWRRVSGPRSMAAASFAGTAGGAFVSTRRVPLTSGAMGGEGVGGGGADAPHPLGSREVGLFSREGLVSSVRLTTSSLDREIKARSGSTIRLDGFRSGFIHFFSKASLAPPRPNPHHDAIVSNSANRLSRISGHPVSRTSPRFMAFFFSSTVYSSGNRYPSPSWNWWYTSAA